MLVVDLPFFFAGLTCLIIWYYIRDWVKTKDYDCKDDEYVKIKDYGGIFSICSVNEVFIEPKRKKYDICSFEGIKIDYDNKGISIGIQGESSFEFFDQDEIKDAKENINIESNDLAELSSVDSFNIIRIEEPLVENTEKQQKNDSTKELKKIPKQIASPEEKKKRWDEAVNRASEQISTISLGKLRAINNLWLDRLINIQGKTRPIAIYVKPRSSSLSMNGVFIYDTRKLSDHSLYLFAGPEASDALILLGEKLLGLFHEETPDSSIIRIIKNLNSPEFSRMMKVIGGHISQIQTSKNAGEGLFFENQFFKTLLSIVIFVNGNKSVITKKNLSVSDLPTEGVAIIDTSDSCLYLWIPHPDICVDDREMAVSWMSNEDRYTGRDVTVISSDCIPPNLKIIFNAIK